jgi:hypothetical protein
VRRPRGRPVDPRPVRRGGPQVEPPADWDRDLPTVTLTRPLSPRFDAHDRRRLREAARAAGLTEAPRRGRPPHRANRPGLVLGLDDLGRPAQITRATAVADALACGFRPREVCVALEVLGRLPPSVAVGLAADAADAGPYHWLTRQARDGCAFLDFPYEALATFDTLDDPRDPARAAKRRYAPMRRAVAALPKAERHSFAIARLRLTLGRL